VGKTTPSTHQHGPGPFLTWTVRAAHAGHQLQTSRRARKRLAPLAATKRHTNAVTAQMVGADRAWSDADGLIAALLDAECGAAREADITSRLGSGETSDGS